MNRSTSQNFNFDDAERGEIKILHDCIIKDIRNYWINYVSADLCYVEGSE